MYTSAVVQLYSTLIIYDIHFYWDNEYWGAVTTPTSYKQGRQIELEYDQNVWIILVLAETNLRWKAESTKCTPHKGRAGAGKRSMEVCFNYLFTYHQLKLFTGV